MSNSISPEQVDTIILACEAGMGSSLMSVNALKKMFKKAKITRVTIVHKPAREIPAGTKLVVVHKSLGNLVRKTVPDAVVVTFSHFLKDPAFIKLVEDFTENNVITQTAE